MARKRVKDLTYLVGTMIEVPRAALTADQIAQEADFFSFGTNDLTQMTMGFSRDDSGRFLGYYVEKGILPKDPFVSLTQRAWVNWFRMGKEKGRAVKPNLKVASAANTAEIRIDRILSPNWVELCLLLAIPCADRSSGCCSGDYQAEDGAGR